MRRRLESIAYTYLCIILYLQYMLCAQRWFNNRGGKKKSKIINRRGNKYKKEKKPTRGGDGERIYIDSRFGLMTPVGSACRRAGYIILYTMSGRGRTYKNKKRKRKNAPHKFAAAARNTIRRLMRPYAYMTFDMGTE
jgi:hypothetical protein